MENRGFTLIELLIVVAIIGILAAIAVPNFLNAQIRAKVARSQADIHTITSSLALYRLDNNGLPPWEQVVPTHIRNLHYLTTPVSYLSVEQMESPFSPPRAVLSMGYWYYNWGFFIQAEGKPRTFYWNSLDHAEETIWMVSSIGPNRSQNPYEKIGENNLLLFYDYNPTNGIVSAGIIQQHGM